MVSSFYVKFVDLAASVFADKQTNAAETLPPRRPPSWVTSSDACTLCAKYVVHLNRRLSIFYW